MQYLVGVITENGKAQVKLVQLDENGNETENYMVDDNFAYDECFLTTNEKAQLILEVADEAKDDKDDKDE